MADCSKTEVFLAEVYRMGMSCEGNDDGGCEHCLISPICNITKFSNKEWREKVISCVQKWSYEHPAPKQKTYVDYFFWKFPNAPKLDNGMPDVCRKKIFGSGDKCMKHSWIYAKEICTACWNEPYKEGE